MQQHKRKDTIVFTEISILVIIWLVVFLSPVILQNSRDVINWEIILTHWSRLIPFLILSLFNHFVLVPFLFFKGHKIKYILGALITLMVFSYMLIINQRPLSTNKQSDFPQEFRQSPPPPPENGLHRNNPELDENRPSIKNRQPPPHQMPGQIPPFVNSFLIALLILGFDTGLLTVIKWTKSEQEKETLEKEKVKSELAFLRNQVSPHFFMNTLNNIHALIDIDSDEAKDALIRLSNLMRHLLYDSEKDLITIKEELNFIKSYVDLMKMRLNEKVQVSLVIDTPDVEKKIPPLLFTSLIENAFKHGISYRNDSFIDIYITTIGNELNFTLKNSIALSNKKQYDSHSGIGLENTKKRLDLLYQDRYTMNITSLDNVFTVSLILPL